MKNDNGRNLHSWGKKIFVLIMTIALVIPVNRQVANAVYGIYETWYFADVASGAWYESAVEYCYGMKYMSGVKENEFQPNAKLTRGMMVTILWNIAGCPKATKTTTFTDLTNKTAYYYNAIQWAAQNKIVSGFDEGYFGPGMNITREQLACMLRNFAKYQGVGNNKSADISKYRDADSVGKFAVEAVKWAVANKIISGKNNYTEIDPKGNASRAEAASMIKNFDVNLAGSNVEIYINKRPIPFTISYQLNGGTATGSNPKNYTVDTENIKLSSPVKSGYVFDGWYKESSFKTKVSAIYKGSSGNITLYAKWKSMAYSITYQLNGGTNASTNPKSYTSETASFLFANPVRSGYTFEGWYKDSSFYTKITGISKGTTGNITIYAKWKQNAVTPSTPTTPTPTPTPTPGNDGGPMVWIPTNGGHRFHNKSSCSSMISPILVTMGYAKSLGFSACGRCC